MGAKKRRLFESQKNQNVSCFYCCQIETWLSSGVPQGSVLGPVLLFVLLPTSYLLTVKCEVSVNK